MTLTKEDLVNSIYNHSSLTKIKSIEVVESLFEIMKRTLADGEDILISSFGKFCLRNKKERRGRNPKTGEDKMIVSRRVVVFKCSVVLRNKINGSE